MPGPPRICLINMPFAPIEAPSLALTQLKAVIEQRFTGRIHVEILHLNLEFLDFTGGIDNYQRIISGHGRLSGAADWLFRQAAFPEAPDNTAGYLDRFHFDHADHQIRQLRAFLLDSRPRLAAFLDRLVTEHRLAAAAIVGFTCLFHQTLASFALARRLKAANPQVVTVAGGAACETVMGAEFAGRVEAVDYFFSGPALVSFPEFVARQLAGDHAGCTRIDGVFCRANLDRIAPTTGCAAAATGTGMIRPTGAELDINHCIPLDYRGFLSAYEQRVPTGTPAPMLLVETSRGCSWGQKVTCTFCGLNGLTIAYRAMSPVNALTRLRALLEYVPRCRFFLAVDTILPDRYLDEVFPLLDTPREAAIMYEVRPILTESQLAALCRAGVLVIQPGIEALSTATLRLMRKGTTAGGNLRFLKRCAALPLRVEWNLLVGSPGEPESTLAGYLELIPRIFHLHPPGGAFPISFDRFSRYFDRPHEHQLDLAPHEFYQYVFPFPAEALHNIAYHFVDRNADTDRLNRWLDQLNDAVAGWHRRRHGTDGRPAARLCMLDNAGRPALFDSRDGTGRTLPLAAATAAVLAFLDEPQRAAALYERFGRERAEVELTRLRDLGVLFEDNGRILSLVTR
jgi:magnesium-protoporphyrin IX monomethyl ester (oxidative) cyclase